LNSREFLDLSKRDSKLLCNDVGDIFEKGCYFLKSKLNGLQTHSDERLVSRMLELWAFYYSTVVPLVLGALTPLQNYLDANENSSCQPFFNQAAPMRPSASNLSLSSSSCISEPPPSRPPSENSIPSAAASAFDLHDLAILYFRDTIFFPSSDKIYCYLKSHIPQPSAGNPNSSTKAKKLVAESPEVTHGIASKVLQMCLYMRSVPASHPAHCQMPQSSQPSTAFHSDAPSVHLDNLLVLLKEFSSSQQ
jgi:hypothetical protein